MTDSDNVTLFTYLNKLKLRTMTVKVTEVGCQDPVRVVPSAYQSKYRCPELSDGEKRTCKMKQKQAILI